jgi:transcription factor-like protein
VRPWVSLPPPQDWTEAEERRRVFWNVFNLDRFCSVAMGWNTSLTSDDVNRRLPCDGITWRKEDPVDTPYFGIWDKAAGRIGNPIAFLPSHYPAPPPPPRDDDRQQQHQHQLPPLAHHHHHHPHASPSEPGVSPSAQQPGTIDMSSVGAFAYSVEATESLSRVNSYFLQQRVDMRDNRDLSSWLTRFKELDLRLVHWKMFLPQKWKATVARQRGARMDPNLTLAHVTHNASMILLHQVMAFPSPAWTFKNRLPSLLSVDTCQAAAVEISAMTQNYLENAPPTVPVASQFAFCIYVAAKVLLLHWRYAAVQTLTPEFWTLVRSLDDVARRWAGPYGLDGGRPCLAAKYSARLTRFHARCVGDETYRISVLGYTTEIDHSPGASAESPTDAEGGLRTPAPVPRRPPPQQTGPGGSMTPTPTNLGPGLPLPLPLGFTPGPGPPGVIRPGTFPGRGSTGSGELGAISQVFMDQQFMDMDRVISYDDGVFGTEYEGGW